MRTVTFADEKVVDLLNEKFVVVWNNHSLDQIARGPQAAYNAAEMAAYPEGGGGNNLHTIVTAPDGAVLSTLKGYWTATTLIEELEFSLGLTLENRSERQAARLKALNTEAAQLEAGHPGESGKRVRQSPVLRRSAALRLLALCHSPEATPSIGGIEAWLTNLADRSRTRVFV